MIKRLILLVPMFLALLVSAGPTFADSKHPRVAELEDKLTADAFSYIKGRFPNLPVLVNVSIDPLRRQQAELADPSAGHKLPYLGGPNDFEIQDEWDDPERSLHELLPRVRAIVVTITLPDSVSDQDTLELRDALFNVLHMIPARDRVDFQRKVWDTEPHRLQNLGLVALLVGVGIFILFLALWFAASRVAKAVRLSANQAPAQAMQAMSPAAAPQPPQAAAGPPLGADVRFNDPLKIKEHVKALTERLANDLNFPSLDDMICLDKRAREAPALLGSLLEELPRPLQNRLFAYSYDKSWLVALSDPGEISLASYELLARLSRSSRPVTMPAWEDLLIVVWRLGDQLAEFLRALPRDDAFAILGAMPTEIAVPAGRKAFPGAWASLLDPTWTRTPLPAPRIEDIKARALAVLPLTDAHLLETYRHEKGLLDFLRVSDPEGEREIYEASPKDASLHRLRAPFYPLFTQDEDLVRELVGRFSIDDWAMALFNVGRPERRRVEASMSEKQRYLLLEALKNLDRQAPDRRRIGERRETIGRELATLKRQKKPSPDREPAAKAPKKPLTALATGPKSEDSDDTAA